jgi:hypothetical protein
VPAARRSARFRPDVGEGRRGRFGALGSDHERSRASRVRAELVLDFRLRLWPRVAPRLRRRRRAGARRAIPEWKRSRNASRLAAPARCSLSPASFSSSGAASAPVAKAVRGSSCSARPSHPRRPAAAARSRRETRSPSRGHDSPTRAGYSSSRTSRPRIQRQGDDTHSARRHTLVEAGRFVVFGTAIRSSCQ